MSWHLPFLWRFACRLCRGIFPGNKVDLATVFANEKNFVFQIEAARRENDPSFTPRSAPATTAGKEGIFIDEARVSISIPNLEVEVIRREHLDNAHLLDSDWMISSLRRNGHVVIPDLAGGEVTERICEAIRAGAPFSVVRLGDGEANLLTYAEPRTKTPILDKFVADSIVSMQDDRFECDHNSLLAVRDMLRLAVLEADIIGVMGLRQGRAPAEAVETRLLALSSDLRGISGQIRGRKLAVDLPDCVAGSAIFASAHLYVGVLNHLDKLMAVAKRAVCLTNRLAAVDALRERFPSNDIIHIPVGAGAAMCEFPNFLFEMRERIMDFPAGTLFLIGAGPWAEIYCRYAKEACSAGVDIGSGFDLLAGMKTRPFHEWLISRNVLDLGGREAGV